MLGSTMILSAVLLLAQAPATGIGSTPRGPGGPPDMPVSTGADAPGSPGAQSRNPAVLRKVTPARAEAFRAQVAERRAQAESVAAALRGGSQAMSGQEIQLALKQDMEAWRAFFAVRRQEWEATEAQWLSQPAPMSAAQWAERRAQWFASRDQWLDAGLNKKK